MWSGERAQNAGQTSDQASVGRKEARRALGVIPRRGRRMARGQHRAQLCAEQRAAKSTEEPEGLASLQGRLHALLCGQRGRGHSEGMRVSEGFYVGSLCGDIKL